MEQVQILQATVNSQQELLTDQDLRIYELQSELYSLKATSVVQGENSEEEGDEDEDDEDSDGDGNGGNGN